MAVGTDAYPRDKIKVCGVRSKVRPLALLGAAARAQPSEDSDAAASAVHAPYIRLCTAEVVDRHSPARSTCAAAPVLRSSPLGADMVGKSRNMSADMLIMPGLLALMPPTICCVRSQSVRDLVTEISGGATPAPVRCGSEL